MDLTTLETVLDISRRMAETRSLDPLLKYVMEEAIKLVGAERGYLVLIQQNGSFDFRVTHPDNDKETTDQISRSILDAVISSGKPLVLRDAGIDPKFSQAKSVMLLKLRSVMCVPMLARGQRLGAIYVENRSAQGRFSENDLPPLSLFANQAAIAIENAALNDQLEARIAQRTQELEEAKSTVEQSWLETVDANRLRTVWLGNIAHDMRAPLTIVIGALGMLRDGEFGTLNEEQAEWVLRSYEAAKRTLELTNDVFDLTKIEFGGMRLDKEEADLATFLRSVHQLGLGLPWPNAVTFRLDLSPDLPKVYIDPSRIQQVILNLVTNALKFTVQGSVTMYAKVRPDTKQVLIGVRDTGKGIAPDVMEQLFKRFQGVTRDPNQGRSGTGLGLAICRELVELHGGRIWVESALGAGSDFKFTLPLDKVDTEQP
jgi:signal transduction histidine kinase